MSNTKYRFSFDMGETSLGWAVFRLSNGTPDHLAKTGVQLFASGRDTRGNSLAQLRRAPRGARRNRDRSLRRRRRLLAELETAGLLPPPGLERNRLVEDASPYDLRRRASVERVSLHEFGRALWHLSQRRGFKSNRKANIEPDENGKIASGAARLKAMLDAEGHKTIGQFLATRQEAYKPEDRDTVRIRLSEKEYEFYPQREMVEAEFDYIWAQQSSHHPELTKSLQQKLRETIFHQRPLKPVPVGRCTFYPNEDRLARWQEQAQEFVIYSQLAHLRITRDGIERTLNLTERDELAGRLVKGTGLTPTDAGKRGLVWKKVRKFLSLPESDVFNLEEGGETGLYVSPLPFRFKGTKKKPGVFPDGFFELPIDVRTSILTRLHNAVDEDDEAEIAQWAMHELGLTSDAAERLAKITLPDGHIRLGKTATEAILAKLKDGETLSDGTAVTITYSEAAKRAGLNHSDLDDGEYFDKLPPYNRISSLQRHIGFGTGNESDPPDIRYGRIANPTVHIGLNQLRRVINALIDRYGKPEEIVLELARELNKSQRQKDEDAKRNKANRQANDNRREMLEENRYIETGQRKIRDKLLRMRLWEELGDSPVDRKCPYTGEPISLSRLMSDEVEIEHILPFSRTLDDSIANKTVALLKANRLKRNAAPSEAADRHPDIFDKANMLFRVTAMQRNKRWRFEDGAMEVFNSQKSFSDRQLNATQYLSRIARDYVSKLYPSRDADNNQRNHVWVVTGKLTSLLRHRWGLNLGDHNRKSRNDHRHHAIDAAVIGVIGRSLIQRLSHIAAREEENGLDRLLADLEEPYAGYCDEVHASIAGLRVNVRANHVRSTPNDPSQTSGKLHEETNYGLVREVPENDEDLAIGNVVRRKEVIDLTAKEIDQVRDTSIREALQALKETHGDTKGKLAPALAEWSEKTGTRRVRLLKRENGIVPIADRKSGKSYRYVIPAENIFIDIVQTAEGDWKGVAMDSFAINSGNGQSWQDIYPDSQFIMRIHKGDTLQLFDDDETNRVKRVYRIGVAANLLYLADVNEGGELQKRHDDPEDLFRWDFANIGKLKARRARRIRFTPAGRMKTIPHGKI